MQAVLVLNKIMYMFKIILVFFPIVLALPKLEDYEEIVLDFEVGVEGNSLPLQGHNFYDAEEKLRIRNELLIQQQKQLESRQIFLNWLRNYSIVSDNNIHMKNENVYGRGIGYATNREINAGEEIVRIPFETIITLEDAKTSHLKLFSDVNPSMPESVILALHLIHEENLGKKSQWYPMIQMFPKELNTSLYYTQEEYSMMNGSQLYTLAKNREHSTDKIFDAIVGPLTHIDLNPPLFNKNLLTRSKFHWALSIVWSHSSLIQSDINQPPQAFISPVLSTIQHDSNSFNSMVLDTNTRHIKLIAGKDHSKGETIHVNLGKMVFLDYVLNYGFVTQNVSEMAFKIRIDLAKDDPLYVFKKQIFESVNSTIEEEYVFSAQYKKIPHEIIASMRLKLLNKEEIGNYKNVIKGFPVSPRNEYVACRSIYTAAVTMLKGYPTSLEEDEARLEQLKDSISLRLLNILQTIIQEKKILHNMKKIILDHWREAFETDMLSIS